MASKNKNKRRGDSVKVSSDMPRCPLVSVIIPVYNSAKFIPQTLESLLYQTMQDFEVVAVDDCSTDNSVEVVESFAEKFSGRLHVIKLPKNTGTPGLPRNVGIQFARGKYIIFLDSDDLLTKTALEELSGLAEEFQADFVHTEGCHVLWGDKRISIDFPKMTDMDELTNPKNFSYKTFKRSLSPLPKTPVFESENLLERLKNWVSWDYDWSTCTVFCLRDFLVKNQIFFSSMRTSEDVSFSFECLFRAKKYLRVPNVTYIIRPRIGSISRDNPTIEDNFHKRIGALNDGFNEFVRIMGDIAFFKNNSNYRYAVLEWFANFRIPITLGFYTKIPAFKLNELVEKEFHTDNAALAAYLFNTVNIYRLQIMKLQQQLDALKNAK